MARSPSSKRSSGEQGSPLSAAYRPILTQAWRIASAVAPRAGGAMRPAWR
jgi:hypothetical protein